MPNKTQKLQRDLLKWYSQHKRDLPWRRTRDPYAIWVSEIMLQQTQVQTVIPYYERWMKKFPTVQILAKASLHEVLKSWEGLGYYARARNLCKAAQVIVEKYGGKIPNLSRGLLTLPGIGPYTASAIASIAFQEDTAVVDGNVSRVLSRIFLVKGGVEKVRPKAQTLLAPGKAGEFNQALMELGALICLPENPQCHFCPLQKFCAAFKMGVQEKFPTPSKRVLQKRIKTIAGLIRQDGKILIHQRPLNGLLGGLWEFPSIRVLRGGTEHFKKYIRKSVGVQIQLTGLLGRYRHTYTHLKETLNLYDCIVVNGKSPKYLESVWKWVTPKKTFQFPFTGICAKARKERLASRGF